MKGSRGVEERRQQILGDVDFARIGELEHGRSLLLRRVLEDDDGMLARGRLEYVPEVGGHGGKDDFVRLEGGAVGTGEGDVDEILTRVEVAERRGHVHREVVPFEAVFLRRAHDNDSLKSEIRSVKRLKVQLALRKFSYNKRASDQRNRLLMR